MFTVRFDPSGLERAMNDIAARQLPFAVAAALTDTALEARKAVVSEMERAFDRPTPFTLNAFEVKPAKKGEPFAEVRQKLISGRRHFLRVEADGGARPSTGQEKLLFAKLGLLGSVHSVIPARDARINQYGNWSAGQRNQVYSALGAQRDAASNTTERSRKRNKSRSTYFIPKSGLSPNAVFERKANGQIGVVLAFTPKAPVYPQRFDFDQVAADRAAAVFPDRLAERFRSALATAR